MGFAIETQHDFPGSRGVRIEEMVHVTLIKRRFYNEDHDVYTEGRK